MTDASGTYPLPLMGREERLHLYRWMAAEERYVADKFDDQRNGHDASLRDDGLDDFWQRQVVQYFDRARIFLAAAAEEENDGHRRQLEQRGQQALAKAMMTAKGLVEASIRVYGPLPKPGVSSGNVEEWV